MKKDKFYRQKLKAKFIIGIFFLVIAGTFTFVVSNVFSSKSEFKKTAYKSTAIITEIKYRGAHISSEGETQNIEYVKVIYNANGQEYTGYLKDISTNMHEGKKIEIYYNTLNPNEFIQYNILDDIGLRAFGYLMVAIGLLQIIVSLKGLILYISTLNGVEVDAKNIEVIQKNIFGSKRFLLKCEWQDEKGINHIFFTEKFSQPYFEKEFEKANISSLKVRFKKETPNKYIVLTEKLDRALRK